MTRTRFHTWAEAVRSESGRAAVTVWTVVFLISGQGFRFLLGLPWYSVVAVLTVATAAFAFRPSLRLMRPAPTLGAFLGLAALSVTWSATRWMSALGLVTLLLVAFLAIVMVRGTTALIFMQRLYRGFQISLLAGILFEVVVALIARGPIPPLAQNSLGLVAQDDRTQELEWSENLLAAGGPIQGFVGNRNPFGAIALMAGILALILVLEGTIRRMDGYATLAGAITVHVLTQSATVSVTGLYLGGLLVAAAVIRAAHHRIKRMLSFVTLALIAVAAVLTLKFRHEIFGAFGRDGDATNRTDTWDAVFDVAWMRPEGWGYVGSWPVWEQPYAGMVERIGVESTTHAHNAYMDALLQMGVVGLVLLIILVILPFGSAWRLVERSTHGDTFVPLGWALITSALALEALTESRLLVEGGWFLLVAMFCSSPKVFALTIVDPEFVHSARRPLGPAPAD